MSYRVVKKDLEKYDSFIMLTSIGNRQSISVSAISAAAAKNRSKARLIYIWEIKGRPRDTVKGSGLIL